MERSAKGQDRARLRRAGGRKGIVEMEELLYLGCFEGDDQHLTLPCTLAYLPTVPSLQILRQRPRPLLPPPLSRITPCAGTLPPPTAFAFPA